jgi:predicted GNAT family acetyltransferase
MERLMSNRVEIRRATDAAEFLLLSQDFRASDLIRTSLITSIATSVALGKRAYESYYWLLAYENASVSGLAIRTVPFGYVFSPMNENSCRAFAITISSIDPEANEFSGPKTVIDQLETFSEFTVVEEEGELIYENRNFTPASSVGEVRFASLDDFELVFKWMQAFIEETHLRNFDLEGVVRNALAANRYELLIVDGVPVSLGGNSGTYSTGEIDIARVGPIYTPPAERKKGYASTITSVITARLLSEGALPTLYTQASNPTSNKIYQKIGYTLVDENRKITVQ